MKLLCPRCEHIEICNQSGDLISCDLRYGDNSAGNPIVIICHSFMAFKDWGFFPYIGERLAKEGFVSLVFNFSHNGVVGASGRITDFKRFERNTISKEVQDLQAVVGAVESGEIGQGIRNSGKEILNRSSIALLGHSRGGAVAIIHAASDRRVKALVTLSSVATLERWTGHQKENWRARGYHPLSRNGVVSPLRLGIDSLNDLEINRDRLSVVRAAGEVSVPWLILHGTEDIVVPPREAEQLYGAANKSIAELVLLEKVGHLYNAETPEKDSYQTLNKSLEMIIHWLHKTL